MIAMRKLLPILLLLSVWPALVAAQKDPTSRASNQPVEPFRILGNLYYVGASDVTSFLIVTPDGNILLDSGFEETVPLIRDSVKKLGFKMEDVKLLLNSHSHFDHAGGLAALKQLTGAKMVAMDTEAPLLARGGKNDFRFGDDIAFPPVAVDRIVHDGGTVTLGGVTLTAHKTPGHTPGNTTWTMKAQDKGKSYDVVFVGSDTINPGVVLTNNPKYPGIAADYAHTFEVLKSLPCDVFLASHGSFFDLKGKAERLRKGETPNPFVDPQGYREHVKGTEELYRAQLAKEAQP
jgi:metallo-beta-lactamase class B